MLSEHVKSLDRTVLRANEDVIQPRLTRYLYLSI